MARFVGRMVGPFALTRSGPGAALAALVTVAACGQSGGTAGSGNGAGAQSANNAGGSSGAGSSASGGPSSGSGAGAAGSSTAGQSNHTSGNGSSGSASGGSSAGSGATTGAGGSAGSGADGGGSSGGVGVGVGDGGSSADGASSSIGAGDGGTPADATAEAAPPPVACQAPLAVTGTAVTAAVDLSTVRATVGSGLMGIYSAVYDNDFGAPTTPPLLRASGVRAVRYPGGSYADIYHWSTHSVSVEQGTDAGAAYVAAGTDFGQFVALIESVGATGVITVDYGSNPQGTGPGVPQEAAAWVAYANGDVSNMTAIGTDAAGTDWQTVSYWASLRAAAPLAVDDGQNFLRISHPAPVAIKYWEVGNELYGNGYYYGGDGWEEDLHLLHNGTPRAGNANLSPVKYGQVFPSFATAMKAVDPTVKVGVIVHWPYTEYASPAATDWNASVLTAATCAAMDFGIDHWYPGSSLTDLLTRPRTEIPMMFSALQAKVTALCPSRSGTLPLAITEWGPNFLNFTITPPAQTQIVGVFAADSYANFMEQGALNVDWLELHNDSYLGSTDTPAWGYHGEQMGAYLANAGDAMVQATVATLPAAFTGGLFQAHASKHADGSTAVMLVNTSPSVVAAATVTVTGLDAGAQLPCVGTAYVYAPTGTDAEDGPVTASPIFSTNDTKNRFTVAVPAYSVVVVTFPKTP
jgi:hypothetical protein